jgi:hypothetical protein
MDGSIVGRSVSQSVSQCSGVPYSLIYQTCSKECLVYDKVKQNESKNRKEAKLL